MRCSVTVSLRLAIAVLLCAPARAETQPTRRDTTARDSVSRDTVPADSLYRRPIHSFGMYMIFPATAVALAAALVAPPAFLLLARRTDTARSAPLFRENHVDVYLTGGPAFTTYIKGDVPWAHSESVEALWDGAYGELRLEHFYMPEYVQYATLRAGHFVHPVPFLSGGVTVGYRSAHGVSNQSGIEIGLPLVVGGLEGWCRVETTYVLSRRVANWNFRTQGIYPIPKRPLFAGLTFEMKSLELPFRDRGQFVSTASLLIGIRY